MVTRFGAGSSAEASSRLLIHAESKLGSKLWNARSIIRRFRARIFRARMRSEAAGQDEPLLLPLALEILDLQGRRVLELSTACAVVDVVLTPGTYHITADLPGRRRRYTVTLVPGASCDLYLRGNDTAD